MTRAEPFAPIERACDVCGETFLITTRRRQHQVRCSAACRQRHNNAQHRLRQAARPDVELTCASCSKPYTVPARWANVRRYCDPCRELRKQQNSGSQAWLNARPEKKQQYARAGRLRRIGLTLEDYETMHAAQGGRCAICRDPIEKWTVTTHADHDHATNKARGLLCGSCNMGLGSFKDSPDRLRQAIRYLRNYGVH